MTFTNKSLHTSKNNMSFIKGATLFFLGMTCVMFATQATFQISPIAKNTQQLIQKIILTSNGSATAATGIYLDGATGNGYFAGKVGIGTGTSSFYTINTNGGLRVGDGESSNAYGTIYSDNSFYKTYIGKYTDENNAGSINYGILINGSGNFGSSMMGLRVIMQNVSRRAATFIGRVGIGTDAPAYDLDVVGTGRFSSGLIVGEAAEINGFTLFTPSPSYSIIDVPAGTLRLQASGSANGITINSGNIGIGNYVLPQALLHVKGPDIGTIALFENGGSGKIIISTSLSQSYITNQATGVDLEITTTTSTGVANDNQIYLNDDGKVGIGSSKPYEKLHVSSNIRLDGSLYFSSNDYLQFTDGTTSGYQFFYDDVEKMRLTSQGRLGIGNKNPDAALTVSGGIRPIGLSSDPCGTAGYPEGTIFYNNTDNVSYSYLCFCNYEPKAKKMHNPVGASSDCEF